MYTGPRKLPDFQNDPAFKEFFVPAAATTVGGRDAIRTLAEGLPESLEADWYGDAVPQLA